MSNEQEFQFINGATARLLLVVEPNSSEFWIDSRASVRVLIKGGTTPVTLEIEYLPGGMVVYASEDSLVQILQNGRLLSHRKQTRHMGAKLMRPRGTRHRDDMNGA
jgi:hypothetical protein